MSINLKQSPMKKSRKRHTAGFKTKCTLIDVKKMRMAGLYDKSIHRGDGIDLDQKLHTKGKVIHLPFRAFNYRQHDRNFSKKQHRDQKTI